MESEKEYWNIKALGRVIIWFFVIRYIEKLIYDWLPSGSFAAYTNMGPVKRAGTKDIRRMKAMEKKYTREEIRAIADEEIHKAGLKSMKELNVDELENVSGGKDAHFKTHEP